MGAMYALAASVCMMVWESLRYLSAIGRHVPKRKGPGPGAFLVVVFTGSRMSTRLSGRPRAMIPKYDDHWSLSFGPFFFASVTCVGTYI